MSGLGLHLEKRRGAEMGVPVPSAPPSKEVLQLGGGAHGREGPRTRTIGDSRSVTEKRDGEVRADPSGGKRCLRVSQGAGEEMLREKQNKPQF